MGLPTLHVLDERYRLDERLVGSAQGEVWRAEDLALARPVAVRFAPVTVAADPAASERFRDDARRAAGLLHAGITQVYDFGPGDPAAGVPPYLVVELVEGRPLAELLAAGPLPSRQTWSVLGQLAAALAAVHEAGLAHGELTAEAVTVCGDGRVKLPQPSGLPGGERSRAEDFRALGDLAFACLTGQAPGGGEALPAATPPPLRALVTALRDDDPRRRPRNAQAIARQAARQHRAATPPAPAPSVTPSPPTPLPPAPPRRRRPASGPALAALAAVALAAVAAGGYLLTGVGGAPTPAPAPTRAAAPAHRAPAAPAPSRPAVHPLAVRAVQLFHPGGSGADDPQGVGAAVDGNVHTAWVTQYYATPAFGNLRPGVGLLFDLGPDAVVRSVHLDLAVPGVSFRVYATNDPARALSGHPVLAASDAPAHYAAALPPTHARYWVVWFTRLAPYSAGYGAGVAEAAFDGT